MTRATTSPEDRETTREETLPPGRLDAEACEEFERLRAHLGLASDAPSRLIDGRYRFVRVIDRGGMGVVYLVDDQQLGRKVALKLIASQPWVSPELLRLRSRNEAKVLASVRHDNVVPIYDIGTHRGEFYLTMPYIEGENLRAWQHRRPRRLRETVNVYLQAARGLAAVHDAGIIHRDFKPENVLLDSTGTAYVSDFGVAFVLGGAIHEGWASEADADPRQPPSGERLTTPGQLLGTLPYTSPEQLRNEAVGARSDQYSFCVSLWEACTGGLPFTERNAALLARAIEQGPGLPKSRIPRWLRRALIRGMTADPERRFSDMPALIRALERGLGRSRRYLTAAGTVLIGSLLVAPWLWSRGPAPEPCESFSGALDQHWNEAVRIQLLAGSYSKTDERDYVLTALDRLAKRWRTDAQALCVDSVAPPVDDERRRCMEAWLLALDRRVKFLSASGDPVALERAPDLLIELAPVADDYCALSASLAVDDDVWALSELARAHAVRGEFERAGELAAQALVRAELETEPFSASAAAALFAQAEIRARARQPATAWFFGAQAHALASGYDALQLEILLLWTKSAALSFDEASVEEAQRYLALIEPFLWRAKAPAEGLRRIEYLEVQGVVERAMAWTQHDDPEPRLRRAMEIHLEAAAGFERLGRPDLAAKAITNAGATAQDLGDIEGADRHYRHARELLLDADVPRSYPALLQTRLNLGNVAIELSDAGELPDFAVAELEAVVADGTPAQRLQALNLLCQLAANSGRFEWGVPYAESALRELDEIDIIDAKLAARVPVFAGFVLAGAERERGWQLLAASLDPATTRLDDDDWVTLSLGYVELLEQRGRCDEASVHAARLRQRVVAGHPALDALATDRPDSLCSLPLPNP